MMADMAGSAHDSVLEIAKERKMSYFGHVTRHPKELASTMRYGCFPGNREVDQEGAGLGSLFDEVAWE